MFIDHSFVLYYFCLVNSFLFCCCYYMVKFSFKLQYLNWWALGVWWLIMVHDIQICRATVLCTIFNLHITVYTILKVFSQHISVSIAFTVGNPYCVNLIIRYHMWCGWKGYVYPTHCSNNSRHANTYYAFFFNKLYFCYDAIMSARKRSMDC